MPSHVLDNKGNIKTVTTPFGMLNLTVNIQTGTPYSITGGDSVVYGSSSSPQAFTLPPATGSGKVYFIKQLGTGLVTVYGAGADTIDGNASQSLAQWSCLMVQDYAAGAWGII